MATIVRIEPIRNLALRDRGSGKPGSYHSEWNTFASLTLQFEIGCTGAGSTSCRSKISSLPS